MADKPPLRLRVLPDACDRRPGGILASVKRRLLNAAAMLSLILALATGGLWGRSYWVYDRVWNLKNPENVLSLATERGHVHFFQMGSRGKWPHVNGWEWDPLRIDDGHPAVPAFRYKWTERTFFLTFPHWSLLLAFAILPALRGWQLLRSAQRRSENLCPQCGYDLRATPQRCPECGQEISSSGVDSV